jgi:hypothetical protein
MPHKKMRMSSLLKWSIGILLALVALGALLSLGDERLDPEVATLLEAPSLPSPAENGYFALLAGIDVAEGEDPSAVGEALAKAYESALQAHRGQGPFEVEPYPAEKRIPIDDAAGSLCQVERDPCLPIYVEQAAALSRLIAEHATPLGRYRDLDRYREFVTATTASLSSPLPSVGSLLATHRLLEAAIGVGFMAGDEAPAVLELVRDLHFQRRLMAGADNLLLKMVALSLFARDVHLYAQMLDVEGFDPSGYPALGAALAPLDEAERSLRKALESELRGSARLFLEDLPGANLFTEAGDPGPDAGGPSFAARIVNAIAYKPNATLNRSFAQLLGTAADLGALPPAELARRWHEVKSASEAGRRSGLRPMLAHFFNWPFNPVGNILVSIAAPEHQRYVARFHDIDGLLRLAELKRLIRTQRIPADGIDAFLRRQGPELADPYTGDPMRYDASRAVLHFDGLSVDGEESRWRAELALYPTLARR